MQPRTITIPFCADDDLAPDLTSLAAHCGLTREGVLERFEASQFTAAFLGFAPGFAYLDGLDASLHMPRLESPRPRVAAGSVAVAAERAGIYPFALPGGWRLLGQTPLVVFDPFREQPALIHAGDAVRFTRIDRAEFERLRALAPPPPPPFEHKTPTLRIIHPGTHATIQDLGRPGLGAIGVPIGGTLDPRSLRILNRILGNADAAAIECPGGGLTVEFLAPATIAFGGADAAATLTGHGGEIHEIQPFRGLSVRPGERLRLGVPRAGYRLLLAIAGGVDVPLALSSRSTLERAGFGGHGGRALRAGDTIGTLPLTLAPPSPILPGATLAPGTLASLRFSLDRRVLRAVPDPSAPSALSRAFFASTFRAMPRSDRAGLRLDPGGPLVPDLAEGPSRTLASREAGPGTIQCPSASEAIALLADGPTTGGYAALARVASIDLPALGQVRPGEVVRFEPITQAQAEQLQQEHDARLEALLPMRSSTP